LLYEKITDLKVSGFKEFSSSPGTITVIPNVVGVPDIPHSMDRICRDKNLLAN